MNIWYNTVYKKCYNKRINYNINLSYTLKFSTNRAIYAGTQTVRVRALLLTTSLKPYEGIADLYLIDPDGYVIRKWNSMEMNVGVLLQDFDLPDYPKVRYKVLISISSYIQNIVSNFLGLLY